MNHGRFITADTETRAAVSVMDTGPWRYVEDPHFKMLCLCYSFGVDEEVHVWHAATEGIEESPFPRELFDKIEKGWLFEAHNAMFERAVLTAMARKHGWPLIPVKQFRCSAAKAAYFCLPRSLEGASESLRTKNRKDPAGKGLIAQLAQPIPVTKAELKNWTKDWAIFDEPIPPFPIRFNEDPDTIRKNWKYCQQDVRTEREVSMALPDMPALELRVWQMDQEMNARGVAVDVPMAHAAVALATEEVKVLNNRLSVITRKDPEDPKSGIPRGTCRAQVLAFLQAHAVPIADTTGETVDRLLVRKDWNDDEAELGLTVEVLEILRKVNRSSTAKYKTLLEGVCADGRIRDLLMYAGAHTQRWAGMRFQPHNFPRGGIKDMELACEILKSRDPEWIRFLYGDLMTLLSHTLRGSLVAGRGKRLWVADFAAIEARVVFWLAQCATALAVFERREDIYLDMASRIYGYLVTKAEAEKRQMGKQSILGLGFGMGFCKFLITLRKYNIKFTEEQVRKITGDVEFEKLSSWIRNPKGGLGQVTRAEDLDLDRDLHELVLTKYVVDIYRSDYPEVTGLWSEMEAAAVQAVRTKTEVKCGLVSWFMDGKRLHCRLPSGNLQTYWHPRVKEAITPWGSSKAQLRHHRLNEKTRQWEEHATYGGELTENIVQHVARDIMAEAMLRVEDHPTYDNVLTVHDEDIAESGIDEGNKEEYEELISRNPVWAPGCPIDVEGWTGFRYKKA